MKTIKTLALFFAAALALTACSSSSDDDSGTATSPTSQGNTTKRLTLTIKNANSTRAVGDIANDEISGVDEANINNFIVGVYDNAATTPILETMQTFSGLTPNNGEYSLSITYQTSDPTIIVMANVPTSTFSPGQNQTALEADTVNLGVTRSGSTQDGTQLPMIGSTTTLTPTTVANSNYNEYTATVELNRMVARVDLTNVTVDRTQLPATDSVHVTGVFIRHALTRSTIQHPDLASSTGHETLSGTPTTDKNFCGYNVSGAVDQEVYTGYEWLCNNYATSPLQRTASTTEPDSVWKNQDKEAYFYVFPNQNTVFANQTQLVIRVWYTRWDASQNARSIDEEEFYPIVVNEVKTDDNTNYTNSVAGEYGTGKIQPNRVYSIAATIIGPGQDGPTYGGGGNPKDTERVRVTVTVKPWASYIHQNVNVGS